MNKVLIELKNVSFHFDDDLANPTVKNISLKIYENEFVTFLGPSGCGKTTTLRMIAGFTKPTDGLIIIDGKVFNEIPPYARPINTVFQRYALFPHLNVLNNVKVGLNAKSRKDLINFFGGEKYLSSLLEQEGKKVNYFTFSKKIKELIDYEARHALEMVNLKGFEKRRIDNMSGGQMQRVAIARAVINRPKILLLDEPLAALDLKLRQNMQYELKEMQRKLGITFIFVTHDQEEAMTMSDRIVVMNNGEIQQIGSPKDIYNEPVNPFVADFIGESNLFNGLMIGKKLVKFLGKEWKCVDDFKLDERVDTVIRPEDIILGKPGKGTLDGKIKSKIFKGVHYEYVIQVGKNEILAKSTKDIDEEIVSVKIEPDCIHIMDKPLIKNLFTNCEVLKNNKISFSNAEIEVDLTKLISGSKLDDNGYLCVQGKKYDLTGAKTSFEIDKTKVLLSMDMEFGQITGVVVNSLYKSDHYSIIVRTDDDEEIIVDTENSFNSGEKVSIKLNKDDIYIRLKGDLDEYEV